MFIKLTLSPSNEEIFINPSRILSMSKSIAGGSIIVYDNKGNFFAILRESPEEINELLKGLPRHG